MARRSLSALVAGHADHYASGQMPCESLAYGSGRGMAAYVTVLSDMSILNLPSTLCIRRRLNSMAVFLSFVGCGVALAADASCVARCALSKSAAAQAGPEHPAFAAAGPGRAPATARATTCVSTPNGSACRAAYGPDGILGKAQGAKQPALVAPCGALLAYADDAFG